MTVVQFHTVIDQEQIDQQLKERLDKACREVLLTWDTNEMSKRLCMSVRTIEDDFLKDDRMRALQRQKKGGKRYWFYEPSLKVIKQIMDEW
ncbi:hypothetical protein MKY34_11135 [Sporosarcina sp. FSL K6-1522]|uniref:hypothetical protein n=1 Tax=Sporosarcina sp. FSL K6-1522 TaxID=2921554 RepID=UPI003159A074